MKNKYCDLNRQLYSEQDLSHITAPTSAKGPPDRMRGAQDGGLARLSRSQLLIIVS